jgi:hypothetical protein
MPKYQTKLRQMRAALQPVAGALLLAGCCRSCLQDCPHSTLEWLAGLLTQHTKAACRTATTAQHSCLQDCYYSAPKLLAGLPKQYSIHPATDLLAVPSSSTQISSMLHGSHAQPAAEEAACHAVRHSTLAIEVNA